MALRSADQAPSVGEKSFDKLLDAPHQLIVTIDKAINKVIPEEFNPFYYLGGITNVLWVLLVPTGIFLWFYYEPTTSKAFISVDYLTSTVAFGNVIRAMSAAQRAAVTEAGGLLFHMLGFCFDRFQPGLEAYFGHCGDARAKSVDLAAGFRETSDPYLLIRPVGDLAPGRARELLEQAKAIGSF